MNNLKIGSFIKEQRIKNNLSQNKLSDLVHVTRQAVSNWETGKAIPDSEILVKLSEIFNVSINDILLGETKQQEDKLQELTLNLIDENNKQKNKTKRLFKILISVIIVFTFSFLAYYFITTYNSIKLYLVSGNSKNYSFKDGLLIHTNNKTYLKIGDFYKNKGIDKVTLFYKDKNNKKRILYRSDDLKSLIVENFDYKDFFNDNFEKAKDKLYIEIEYKNEKEIVKLNIKENFKNSSFFKFKPSIEKKDKKDFKKVADVVNNTESKEDKELELEKEETKTENKTEEKTENKIESRIENKLETQSIIVEQEKVDYERVAEIIRTKGNNNINSIVMEYMDNDAYIYLTLSGNNIAIEYLKENYIKSWEFNYTKKKNIKYVEYIDYNEIQNIRINFESVDDNEIEIIKKMDDILNNLIKSN